MFLVSNCLKLNIYIIQPKVFKLFILGFYHLYYVKISISLFSLFQIIIQIIQIISFSNSFICSLSSPTLFHNSSENIQLVYFRILPLLNSFRSLLTLSFLCFVSRSSLQDSNITTGSGILFRHDSCNLLCHFLRGLSFQHPLLCAGHRPLHNHVFTNKSRMAFYTALLNDPLQLSSFLLL